ncbi:hypothetical protein QBC39DRAFT_399245 [Podospora conica]|nr:hypothetical protein QBC39DRAFT_399245 [Schizothecium conicum]
MASKPQCGQITNNTGSSDAQPPLPKRPPADDDELEFLSANPVKKRQAGPQTAQATATQQQPSMPPPPSIQFPPKPQANAMAPPPPPPPPQQVMAPPLFTTNPVIPQLDRCQSLQPNAPVSDMSLDGRGFNSVPNFDNFAFPPPQFSSASFRPPRLSEAISPKQLPQSFSHELHRSATPAPRPPEAPMQSATRLDQISCLEFHGSPLNFEMGKFFTGDMAGPNEFTASTTAGPTSNMTAVPSSSMAAPAGFGSIGTQNGIPFAMYSTGNFVPMPQQHHGAGPQTSISPSMLQTGPGPTRAMGAPSPSHNHPIWDKTKHPHSYGHSRPPGGVFQGSPYPVPHCLQCVMENQQKTFRQPLHGPVPSPLAGTPHRSSTGNTGMPNHPAPLSNHNYLIPTTPTNPSGMPNQPAPLPHHTHQHHPIPSTYRSNTPAPTPHDTKRPPPPGPPPPAAAAPKKPHPQNLIVDVAETVERCFPYSEVAARHNVTPAKVEEALSAVVLLPALRCATDKRRAGKLAQDRMKVYRDVRGQVQQKQGDGRGEGTMAGLKEMAWLLEGGGGGAGGGGNGR